MKISENVVKMDIAVFKNLCLRFVSANIWCVTGQDNLDVRPVTEISLFYFKDNNTNNLKYHNTGFIHYFIQNGLQFLFT